MKKLFVLVALVGSLLADGFQFGRETWNGNVGVILTPNPPASVAGVALPAAPNQPNYIMIAIESSDAAVTDYQISTTVGVGAGQTRNTVERIHRDAKQFTSCLVYTDKEPANLLALEIIPLTAGQVKTF
jgi:hypothetical protein